MGRIGKRLLALPGALYDRDLGWLLGHRFLRLTHAGRRSGRRYRTVLEVVEEDLTRGEVVVLAGLGRRADWYLRGQFKTGPLGPVGPAVRSVLNWPRNLEAGSGIEVELGGVRFAPAHRTLGEDEAAGVLAGYERRNRAVAPLVRRVLSALVGWHYDGSDAARRRLVRELPLVALRPAGHA